LYLRSLSPTCVCIHFLENLTTVEIRITDIQNLEAVEIWTNLCLEIEQFSKQMPCFGWSGAKSFKTSSDFGLSFDHFVLTVFEQSITGTEFE
jgi:hypothetical protein